jgi:signal transduction histidine kinase
VSITPVLRLLAALIFCVMSFATAEGMGVRKRVLYISSYHPSFPSVFPQIAGVKRGLAEMGFKAKDISLDLEFMDTKRFAPESQLTNLTRRLALIEPYDVIIAADDAAFELAIREQAGLFQNAPVVFLGVNNRAAALAQNTNPRITGVIEARSVEANLKLITKLYPESRRIFVITDGTGPGKSARKETIRQSVALPRHQLELFSLAERSYEELYAHLAALPADIPLFLLSAYRDKNNVANEFGDVLARIKLAYNGPIFVTQSHGIGHGVLGGEVIDHNYQGQAAGVFAGQVLSGIQPSTLPVIDKSPNPLTIDYNEAKRLKLNINAFPKDATFVNRPLSVLEEHRNIFLILLGVGAAQTGIIILLILNTRRRRAAEQAAIDAQIDSEVANKTKTEFLANMSHELRTPLNSVIGFSDVMLADRVGAISREKRDEYLSDIRESGLHLLDLLNNILDVAKIEMGKLAITDEEINLKYTLKLCHRMVAERAATNNTRLELALPEDCPNLRADPTRLKQSVLNLLSNAIKFSDGGGTVTTTAIMDDNGDLNISVNDQGPGIPISEMEWVMEPFNRGRSSHVNSKEGSGIGLPLTASLMQNHGGSLDLESEVGVGTTATLHFPAARVLPPRSLKRLTA